MPWHIEHRGDEWCVVEGEDTESAGDTVNCHETEEKAKAQMRALYASEGSMTGEALRGLTFVGDQDTAATFSADSERRIISGIVVPWGKVARNVGMLWRFAQGSLRWADTKRVKLNLHHDRERSIGYAARLHNTVDGLEATFKIARGEEGDQALKLAEDGVLDGFSIEVPFDDGFKFQRDPNDPDVRVVTQGRLAFVGLTADPAFEDARATYIAAVREEGREMPNEEGAVKLEEDDASMKFDATVERLATKVVDTQNKFMEGLAQSIGESVSAGMRAAVEDMGQPEGRGEVKAARYSVTREEPVYRFDGSGESLVRDAWNSITAKDENAIERLRKFRQQTEDIVRLHQDGTLNFAPQSTSTASQVIPPGYRPDLYVGDLFRDRPFIEAATRATIPNAAPFSVPVFSSVSGASADHVEGTNPSDGSLTFTTRTVTPQAISGRIVLTRELVDSSNPTIDNIALQEMRESYARQTEAKVYTLLNGTSGAGGTITTGFVPSGSQAATFASTGGTPYAAVALVNGIRQQMALYPFRRFSAPTAVLMGPNATTTLATANDSTGRPIFPSVGPVNAVGSTGGSVTTAWNVEGFAFQPAWSITGTAAGDTQIFIFNRSDVYVFESPLLTFRFEEKQGPANIELNIFGYFGTHLLRPVGLSGIRIT
jgi:phage head maturation protease